MATVTTCFSEGGARVLDQEDFPPQARGAPAPPTSVQQRGTRLDAGLWNAQNAHVRLHPIVELRLQRGDLPGRYHKVLVRGALVFKRARAANKTMFNLFSVVLIHATLKDNSARKSDMRPLPWINNQQLHGYGKLVFFHVSIVPDIQNSNRYVSISNSLHSSVGNTANIGAQAEALQRLCHRPITTITLHLHAKVHRHQPSELP